MNISEQNESEPILIQEYKSPAGALLLGSYRGRLCLCDWKYRTMRDSIDRRIQKILKAVYKEGQSAVLEQTVRELNEYFSNKRKVFEVPLLPAGSEFQRQVWEELEKIPFGKTSTYMELAVAMNKKEAIRAVASANGANAISIMIPCHRVIGSSGELVGYAGGLSAKKKLLDLESSGASQLSLF